MVDEKKTITLTEKRFFEWHEDDVSVTLRNRGGSYGGGSEVLIICTIPKQSEHYRQGTTKELAVNMSAKTNSL
jgi:hypothetical protein